MQNKNPIISFYYQQSLKFKAKNINLISQHDLSETFNVKILKKITIYSRYCSPEYLLPALLWHLQMYK